MDPTTPRITHQVTLEGAIDLAPLLDAAFPTASQQAGATALRLATQTPERPAKRPAECETIRSASAENNFTPQPTNSLQFPQDELAAMANRNDLWPVIGARSAYTVLEHPGIVIRIDPLARFIQGTGATAPSIGQGRGLLQRYEQELDLLQAQGVAILPRTTRLQENDDGTVMLMTAVEQHTAPKTLLHESLDPDNPVAYATVSLGVLRMIAQYFTTSEQPIRGIADEKAVTTDGTLLDYDPYICSLSDHYEAYKHMLVWCQSLSNEAGQEIPLMHLRDFLAQRFAEAAMQRTFG